jgi:hypothetical protein
MRALRRHGEGLLTAGKDIAQAERRLVRPFEPSRHRDEDPSILTYNHPHRTGLTAPGNFTSP